MKSKLFHSLICIVTLFACYIASTVKASAETNLEVLATGSCGDNVTYTIYSDYSMVISGTGAMKNYSSSTHINNDYNSSIEKVFIEEGVTYIGDWAFSHCSGLTSVTIPNSVTSIGNDAFRDCEGLTSVTIPNSVTSIGKRAFAECTSLTSVSIPNSVTSIVEAAFSHCTGLTSVTIPNGVTSIGNYAFQSCTGLTSVTIPNGVTSIGNDAFSHCSGLTSVTIPNSVTSIGNDAFRDCEGLTSVTIPNSVTSIGKRAFAECAGLTSVTIPNSVTSIVEAAFSHCTSLTSVTIPNSVTSIDSYAFDYCIDLTSVTIPNSVTSIGNYAFQSCTGLTSVTIPNSVTSIGDYAFSGCTGLTTITSGAPLSIGQYTFSDVDKSTCTLYVPHGSKSAYENAQYWSEFQNIVELEDGGETKPSTYTDNQGVKYQLINNGTAYKVTGHTDDFNHNLIISASLFGLPVIEIGSKALGWSELESVVLPEGIEIIGMNAINDCNITSLVIPATVNSLYPSEDNPFSADRLLSSIKVEEGNEVYDSRDNCNAIIETATNRLVSGCMNTVIPQTVTSIGRDAFYASQFSSITLPAGITSIGEIAFTSCDKLNTIYAMMTTPASVVNGAFENYHYSNVTLYVPKGSKTLYQQADVWRNFQNIVELEDGGSTDPEDGVLQPDGTTTWTTFQGVKMTFKVIDAEKKWVQVGNGVDPSISQATTGEVTIPNEIVIDGETYTVVGIGDYGFYNCDKLTAIWLPENLQFIGKYAFYGCKLVRKIQIPETVYAIDETAFEGCTGLTEISCPYIPGYSYPSIPSCHLIIVGYKPSDEDFDVVIPQPVTSIGERAFSYCANIRTMRVEEGNTVFDSRDNCNAIIRTADNVLLFGCKSTVIPTSVTAIDAYAFEGHTGLSTIAIPASVASIGQGAFADCTGLTSVTSNIQNPYAINDNTFSTTTYETATLYVPYGTKSAYQAADGWKNFLNIVELENGGNTDPEDGVLQPDGTTTWTTFQGVKMTFKVIDAEKKWVQVGNGVDPSISQATTGEVTIPNEIVIDGETYTVVGIGDYGFYNCDKLTAIWLPENLQFIGKYAFYGCKLVGKIQIPETVYAIDDTAFEGCTGLTEISCPYIPGFSYPSVPIKIIGYKPSDEDFDVVIPQPVTSIGERAFSYCANIRTMRVEEGNTVFDSRDNCNAIIRTADNVLLFGCKSTEIPSSVTAIDAYAFEGHTGLSTIAIPASVASIGQGAFADCTGLTTVTSNIQNPYAINDNTFSTTTYETATLYVPYGTKSAYQAADGWKNFLNIVEMEEELDVLATGQCGDNLTYTIYPDYSMVISGTGTMWDYDYSCITPDYKDLVQELTIEEGVADIGAFAFSQFTSITSLTIPNSVTTIGKFSFGYCVSVTSVDFGSGVSSIGNYAFNSCQGLVSLTIPDNVIGIDDYAFAGCSNLTSLTIGSGLRGMGTCPFAECNNLSTIIVDERNQHFDSRDNCNALINSVNNNLILGCNNSYIPDGVTEIRSRAFSGCTGLTTIRIPNSVTGIESGAFSDCTGLTTIEIPNSVTYIGSSAFYGCTGLTTIKIPNSMTSISDAAFSNCTSLTSVVIPNSVTNIWADAFSGCSNMSSIIVGSVEPPVINTEGVFDGVDKSTCTLFVPNGSKTAYESADYWKDFTNILEFRTEDDNPILAMGPCGDHVIFIVYSDMSMTVSGTGNMWNFGESWGFNDDYFHEVENIIVEEGVTSLGDYAFCEYMSSKSISLPNSLTSIGYYAFLSCNSLESLSIPRNVTYIGIGLMSLPILTSDKLASITVDPNNPVFDSRDNCNAIIRTSDNELVIGCKNTVIPNTVTSIGHKSFGYCKALTSIEIPNSVTSIGWNAFGSCSNLVEVTVPSSVTFIDSYAFAGTPWLANQPDGMIYINNVAYKYKGAMPEETSIILNEGTVCISNYAFINCKNLISVEIPNSVTTIGNAAFSGCSGLTSITLKSSTPTTFNMTPGGAYDQTKFDGLDQSACTLYVPYGSKSAYENAACWSKFGNIVEMEEELDVLATGQCGDNLTYNIYSDMSMVISGTGDMWNYESDAHINDEYYLSVQKVIIEDGVTTIGKQAFRDFKNLTSVDISNSVTSIGILAFHFCKFASIDIPNSVTTIADEAFYGCHDLTSVTIPSSVTSIIRAFSNCGGLTSISVDAENSTYDSRDNCNAIIETATNTLITGCKNTVIPNSVASIGDAAFYMCFDLTSIDIPNSVTSIGNSAFGFCNNLTSLSIPNGVTSIGHDAFFRCSQLETVVIPQSVTYLGISSFGHCGLTSVTVGATIPSSLFENTFEDVNKSTCTLYVPYGSKSAYENAEYWNEFENIVEYGEEPDTDISTLDNAIYVDHIEGRIGGTMDIPIKVKNSAPIEDFKFKMILPAGTTVNSWALSSNRLPSGATVNNHTSEQNIEGNTITLACMLNYNESEFTGNDGEIATVNVTFGENMEVGTYPIRLIECNIGHIDLSDVKATLNLEDYVVGDANGDGRVRIGDASAILHYIVGNPSADFNEKAADVNGDGLVRIGDVSAVLKIIVGL